MHQSQQWRLALWKMIQMAIYIQLLKGRGSNAGVIGGCGGLLTSFEKVGKIGFRGKKTELHFTIEPHKNPICIMRKCYLLKNHYQALHNNRNG